LSKKITIKIPGGHAKDTEIWLDGRNLCDILAIRSVRVDAECTNLVTLQLEVYALNGLNMEFEPELINVFGIEPRTGLTRCFQFAVDSKWRRIWYILSGQRRADRLISRALMSYKEDKAL